MPICRICHSRIGSKAIRAKEMMYGLRTLHEYFQCDECGCLQIAEYPTNLASFYRENYYSHLSRGEARSTTQVGRLMRRLRRIAVLQGGRPVSRILHLGRNIPLFYQSVAGVGISKYSRILDVGCGSGWLLEFLLREGFKDVAGYDPFTRVSVIRCDKREAKIVTSLRDLKERYDLVYACRSFEHMPEPRFALRQILDLLSQIGSLVLVLPVIGFGWTEYRENWVQLDAPRHLYIHSRRSIELLLEGTSFEIKSWNSISSEFLFWGSEQYKMDVPLAEHDLNRTKSPKVGLFTKKQIQDWRRKAQLLNRENKGDEAIVWIVRKNHCVS